VAIHPRPGRLVAATLVTAAPLVLFDLTRLQPWFYFYLLFFCGLAAVDWNAPNSPRKRTIVALCGFIIVATYLWSGLQKANLVFAKDVFPWLLEPLGALWVERLRVFWLVAPIVEFAIGLMLFIPRTRRWGLVLGCVMHLSVLLAIGPFGLNFNSVVWPWNIGAPILAIILFHRNDRPVLRPAWSTPVGKFVVVLAGILPALNFVGCWDTALSASLYSGRATGAWIYLTPAGASRLALPEPVRREALDEVSSGRFRLDVVRWAESALNVPPYGEPRVYRRLVRQLEQSGISRSQMTLVVYDQGDDSVLVE
jgi:hypothetical protein